MMRLSTKGRYAITAMMQLAQNEGCGPLTLADISQEQGVSLSYLEQLFARLRKHGLVKGVRGPGGGYRLAKEASEVSIARIIDAVDDRTPAERERMFAPHLRSVHSQPHNMWMDFSKRLYDFLNSQTLDEFINSEGASELLSERSAA